MSEAPAQLALRDNRKPGWFWVDNETVDCYQPIVGADAVWVYCRIARNAHGAWIISPRSGGVDRDPRVGLREMSEWCGKSVDTVWRCLQVLQAVGLVKVHGAAKSKGRYALVDVKDLVLSEGGVYDRATGSLQLPEARVSALRAEVRELKARLARKAAGLAMIDGGRVGSPSVAQSDRLDGGLFSASDEKCDRTVALSDTSVAPERQTSISTRLQDCKTEKPPQPPSAAADGGAAGLKPTAPDREIDDAVQRVMDAVGVHARRFGKVVTTAIGARVKLGESAAEVAGRMAEMWERYLKCSARGVLFKVESAKAFIEDGLWLSSDRWNFDQAALREEQMRAKARVGSF